MEAILSRPQCVNSPDTHLFWPCSCWCTGAAHWRTAPGLDWTFFTHVIRWASTPGMTCNRQNTGLEHIENKQFGPLWGLKKMSTICRTFYNGFSSRKTYEFLLELHWGLFIKVPLMNVSNGSGTGLAPNKHYAIARNNMALSSFGPLGTNLSEIQIEIL